MPISVEVRAVGDTQIMVPAIAGREPEHGFYMLALHKCWKFVFSDKIVEEYQRVIQEFGFRGDVIIHELNKLDAMNKYRKSRADHHTMDEELAPRKDKHIIAACQDIANVLISTDRGILTRKEIIEGRLGIEVLSLEAARNRLANTPNCR